MSSTAGLLAVCMVSSVSAQVVTDGTVGAAGPLAGPDFVISEVLGQRFGTNLFHSFSDFNVLVGESATFTSSHSGVTSHVIGRVTGSRPTVIDGLLRSTIPGADLWLLNPNGLLFGGNARIDVPAGFHASTADTLRLADGGEFRVTDAAASSLTVAHPVAFGFFDTSVAAIRLEGAQLAVAEGNRLSLVGGHQTLTSAALSAPSGRIDLVAVAGAGDVGVGVGVGTLPMERANLDLDSGSRVFAGTVGGQAGGDVLLVGNAISLLDGSVLDAGSSADGAGGTVTVRADIGLGIIGPTSAVLAESRAAGPGAGAAGSVSVSGDLLFIEQGRMSTGALAGAAGTIQVDVGSLSVINGAALSSSSRDVAFSGEVNVVGSVIVAVDSELRAGRDVTIAGPSVALAADARVEAQRILLNVDSLSLDHSALGAQFVQVSGRNSGPAESVTFNDESFVAGDTLISAREILLSGESSMGAAGTPIVLRVDRLIVAEGSRIGVGSVGGLDGGSIEIRGATAAAADDLSVGGIGRSGAPSRIVAGADFVPREDDSGSGGPISVAARRVELFDGGEISSSSSVRGGGGGAIVLEVDELMLSGGALISSSTLGDGDAGSVRVLGADSPAAQTVAITGENSGIFTSSEARTRGNAGSGGAIRIDTELLELADRATLSSSTSGRGAGGSIDLRVDRLRVQSASTVTASTGLATAFATPFFEGTGDAGDITIRGREAAADSVTVVGVGSGISSDSRIGRLDAGAAATISVLAHTLRVSDFGSLSVATIDGAGGTLQLGVDQLVVDAAGLLTATTSGRGNAGDITIGGIDGTAARSITLLDAGRIDSASSSLASTAGDSGTIRIRAEAVDMNAGASIAAGMSGGGTGGSVALEINALRLGGGSGIATNTLGSGDAGDIAITGAGGAARLVEIAGAESGLFSDSRRIGPDAGRAGSVSVAARSLEVREGGVISVATVDGVGGRVEIGVDELTVDAAGSLTATTFGRGNAGDILIGGVDEAAARRLLVRNEGRIDSSSLSVDATGGTGGRIELTADAVVLETRAVIAASTSGGGAGGSVRVEVDDLSLTGASGIFTNTVGIGDGGDIRIFGLNGAARSVEIADRSGVVSDSRLDEAGAGRAGSVSIAARNIAVADFGLISVQSADGGGGTIELLLEQLALDSGGSLAAITLGTGDAGDIAIAGLGGSPADRVSLRSGARIDSGSRSLAATAGDGGTIRILAERLDLDGGSSVAARMSGGGAGGSVALGINELLLQGGSEIVTSTSGSGNAGDIAIAGTAGAARQVAISGAGSGLFSDSSRVGADAGRAGNISVAARALDARDLGSISVATVDGSGGSITLDVDALRVDTGGLITAEVTGGIESGGAGTGGDIIIQASTITLASGGTLSVRSSGSGAAGSVLMDAARLSLSGGSRIDATATGSLAGNVELNISDIMWLQDSLVSGLSADPDNDGGNFVVQAPRALVLQRSRILANSASSRGGNISIVADAIVLDPASSVEATGEVLTAGEVLGGVLQLDAPELLDAGAALDTRCTPQQIATRSSMVVRNTPRGAVHEPYLMPGGSQALRPCAL